ncbi:MAG: hypothetical protein L0G10_10165 [Acinetobacter sp.]|nr:hypothetical protein [Acinetobacter sp.]
MHEQRQSIALSEAQGSRNRASLYRYRYYSYNVGRYIIKDPIGLFGGLNKYQYAPNSKQWVDVLGLNKYFIGSIDQMSFKASALKSLVSHSKEWMETYNNSKLIFILFNPLNQVINFFSDFNSFIFR